MPKRTMTAVPRTWERPHNMSVRVAQMGHALGQWGAYLVVLGGVIYSIGGLIYALRWPDPSPKVPPGPLHCVQLLLRDG